MSWHGDMLKAGIASNGRDIDIFDGDITARNLVSPPGNIYHVDYRNGLDIRNGRSWKNAFKTYSAAVAAVTDNNNDYILIDGDSEVVETAMVEMTKNRVHTVGMNGPAGHFGQGARISCTLAAGVTNVGTFKNSGVRNTFSNIKFINANTVAEGVYCLVEGGE